MTGAPVWFGKPVRRRHRRGAPASWAGTGSAPGMERAANAARPLYARCCTAIRTARGRPDRIAQLQRSGLLRLLARARTGVVDHERDAAIGQSSLAHGTLVHLAVLVLAVAHRAHLLVAQAGADEVIAYRLRTAQAQTSVVRRRTGRIGETFHGDHGFGMAVADHA